MRKEQDIAVVEGEIVLDPMTERLLEFVSQHGNPAKAAKKLGMGRPTVFYHYAAGKAKPSADTIALFAKAYADFDPMYILTGIPSSAPREALVAEHGQSVNDVSSLKLQFEIESLRRENETLKRDKERYWQMLAVKSGVQAELDFLKTSSQSTVTNSSQLKKRTFTPQDDFVLPLFENAVPMGILRGMK